MRLSDFALAASMAVGLAVVVTGPAAAQGKGNSDSATATVTANVPALVRISKLDDITFDNVDFTQKRSKSQGVCVWTNTAGDYNLTVTSDSGDYTLASQETADSINYDVAWAPKQSASQFTGATKVDNGATNSFQSDYTNPSCQGNTNADLYIQLQTPSSDEPVAEGTYTDKLTLKVEPI